MRRIIIVTGADGFLGNNIIRILQNRFDGEIRALVMSKNRTPALNSIKCRIYYGDVTVPGSLNAIFDIPPDAELYVIHCAAKVYIKAAFDRQVYDVNVNGTLNVAEQALMQGGKLIYVSSVHAIPEKPGNEPMSETAGFNKDEVKGLYAKTKAEAAAKILDMVSKKGLNAVILHPSGIIGPYDYGPGHTTQLIMDYCNRKLTACVNGGYNFVDVRDAANGVISACEMGERGECYILANKTVTIKEMLDIIGDEFGLKKIRTILPTWFARLTAPLSGLYYSIHRQPPLYTGYSLYTLNSNSNFCSDKAAKILNFRPRDIKDTLKDTVKWLYDNKMICQVDGNIESPFG